MGDFYECFDDDARVLSEVLGIALTSRPMGREGRIPLAGVPHHQLERHLERLVAAGHRVAIAEQLSPPGTGLVERAIVRVVSPGTVDAGAAVEGGAHNWLVAAAPAAAARSAGSGERPHWGVARCDVTTGELELELVPEAELAGEWARLRPAELLLPDELLSAGAQGAAEVDAPAAAPPAGCARTPRPARDFAPRRAAERLAERFGVAELDGYGLEGLDAAVGAAGALLAYLEEGWPQALAALRAPHAIRGAAHVYLDPQTRHNLDLFSGGRGGDASLVAALDRTRTAMGGRLLREHLGRPLRRAADAEARLDEVEAFVSATLARSGARAALRGVPDTERLLGRVRAGSAGARHLLQLAQGLDRLPALRARADEAGAVPAAIAVALGGCEEIAATIAGTLDDDPPPTPGEGATVRGGVDPEVDRLRALATDARSTLVALEAAERERSGIASLKVGYHRVLGYYFEVPRAHAERVPSDFEPRQALTGSQRFRTAQLVELEGEILTAKDRLLAAEQAALARLVAEVAAAGERIAQAGEAAARLDVASALAEVAVELGHVRPELAESGAIAIEAGRHPVVERELSAGAFVPNDCTLGDGADIVVLTGPNMGGKSTYLRQTALIVLLAQCGCYVPARRARVAMVDRVFSRVGAQDEIAAGRSTFMVEMLETAAILHNATARSLVILDEVGRGTSTNDGLAIARAVVEHLHHLPGGTPRTLFATHYQELTQLSGLLPRLENRSVAVREEGGEVVLLHRIVPGGADRAYGVHVAQLAGLPAPVVVRARELLAELEAEASARAGAPAAEGAAVPGGGAQLPLAAAGSQALLDELAALDPDGLAPLAALQRLYELRARARRLSGVEG
jgi:DNA mismatch repair protein MutS